MNRSDLTWRGMVLVALTLGIASVFVPANSLPGELTLDDAVSIALADHPRIAAASAAVSGQEGLVTQSGLRPNPTFHLQTENWRFTGTPDFRAGDDLDLFAFLSQPLETAGKRDRRLQLARTQESLARLARQKTEWEIRQSVKTAFWQAVLAQREVELLTDSNRYFEQFVDFHRNRVREGAMAEADLIRVELEQERLEVARQEAELASEEARLELLRRMGQPEQMVPFSLSPPSIPPLPTSGETLDSLNRKAVEARLDILMSREKLELARARFSHEKARARPDVTLQFGYKRTEGYNTILGGVSIPLPVLDSNQGNIAFGRSEMDRAAEELRAVLLEVRSDVATALKSWRRRHRMLSQMESAMQQRAEESLEIALAAYREGSGNLLRVLDGQRARNEVQLLLSRTRLELQKDVVRLESAVGSEKLDLGLNLLKETNDHD